jgi:hypothetical protein
MGRREGGPRYRAPPPSVGAAQLFFARREGDCLRPELWASVARLATLVIVVVGVPRGPSGASARGLRAFNARGAAEPASAVAAPVTASATVGQPVTLPVTSVVTSRGPGGNRGACLDWPAPSGDNHVKKLQHPVVGNRGDGGPSGGRRSAVGHLALNPGAPPAPPGVLGLPGCRGHRSGRPPIPPFSWD